MTTQAAVTLALLFLLPLVPLLIKPLGKLCKLAGKALAALASLALLNLAGGVIGLSLGVNLLNALVIALLGVPGFGLLMMLDWVGKL